ncbi:ribonuclease HI [Colwellia sp. M166]|uniref:ribonuclease H family protein n=1 Tax=Colwellia sp. M166 TaxID=2583805 RepID=UPI00211DD1CF|nr:ribonuclease H family protein [Colwellia sp. M166]UUO21770.1 ribonuclease HI [Colwellia sp. M166]|tara:strand:+ start:11811 stop:12608 length:798 start_codon:yes stop_codon:yes gene_type:complete
MAKKFYVVWKGAKTGVFEQWNDVKSHTQGRADAQYMGFESKAEAELAFQSTYTKALTKRSISKNGGAKPSASAAYVRSDNAGAGSASSPAKQIADFNIYCDGACSPNPGKSGTGMAVYQQQQLIELWYGLYEPMGTNNTAELNGMLAAFKYAQAHVKQGKTVQVLSDSKYSIDCITKWAKGWQAKGWTRGKGEEIKNLDVIKQCFTLYQALKENLIISHVKGHANIEGNELSDRMAVLARMKRTEGFVQYQETLDIKTILAMASG